jgi:hypothetical protein
MKPCIRCGESKPISEFYVHKMMADGHLNKCKSCCRSDATANRVRHLSRYRQYDRERFSTLRRRMSVEKQRISYRTRYPEKRAAHVATGNAIRSGKLVKGPCEVCGSLVVDAHHDDYSKPLEVRWLCRVHHLIHHGRFVHASA